MQRIVDETFRRGRFVTQFVAAASLISLITACGTDGDVSPTEPRAVDVPPVVSTQFGLGTDFDLFVFSLFTPDVGGANDDPAQSDLNVFSRADNRAGKLAVAWAWDDINSWTGGGQTGDACALFDTDPLNTPASQGGGNADYAVCVRITNPNGDPTQIAQLAQPASPILYQCSDKKTDRCTTTFSAQALGGSFCEVVGNSPENFPGAGDDGFDILAACSIELSAIGNPSRTSLLNVCSFPSGSPNSNPFDCVVTAGSGFIQIKKKTAPQNSGQTFGFTVNPASANGSTFSITDNTANDEATALLPVAPGTYSVTESTIPSGWSLSAASCTGAGTNGSKVGNAVTGIVIAVGETAVCTFENAQSGSITIVKDALPNDQQDFAFTGNITGCTSFTLDDDAGATGENTTNSSQKVCAVGAGTYNVDEAVPSDWVKTSATCSDGSPITTIAVSAGENVTCTFTNTKNGSITIVKDALPNDAQDFVFAGNITGCTSFTLDDDAGATDENTTNSHQKVCAVAPGTFSVDETQPTDWVKTSATCSDGSPITAIAVSAGENITCTFTNTKNGSITIVKDANPNDQQDFVFTGTITGCTSFTLDDDAGATGENTTNSNQKVCAAAPGTYNVDETVPSEWTKSSATCSDGSPITAIALSAGENITCTFVNTKGGSITIVKDALPNDQQDFVFAGNITNCTSFTLDDDGGASGADNTNSHQKVCAVAPGTYSVDETVPANWVKTSATCSDGSPITAIAVAAGESVTCTFTNTKNGSITIVKDANPNDQQDFAFTGNITNCTSFTLDDDAGATGANSTYSNEKVCPVAPGTYNVDETVPPEWTKTSATCSDGSPITAIAVSAGESVTCTFLNTKGGSITIVKDATPNDEQDFAFTGTITNCTSFTLDDDAGATGANGTYSNEKVCAVAPGTYNVDETVPGGWTKTSAICSDGSPISSIQVAAGESVTCTFTNTKHGSIKIVKDAVPDNEQNFGFTPSGFADNTPFTLDDDANATLPSFKLYSGLLPGSRTVTEGSVGGWAISNISCTGATAGTVTIGATGGWDSGDNSVTINLAAGDNVVCTFENTAVAPGVEVTKTASPTSIPETGGKVTYTVKVKNTSTVTETLTSLVDDKFGNLNGKGSGGTACSVPQTLAPNAEYICSFTETLAPSGAGSTHTNVVTATAINAGLEASDTDDAEVTYLDVLPAISVSKNATLGTFTGVSGTLPASFLATLTSDRTFTTPPNPPPASDPNFASSTCDDKGANDINSSQVDLNCFSRADNLSGRIFVRWTWDGTDDWGGTGATGDGCALVDTGTDGKADIAVCARITNATGPITQVPTAGAADVYTCSSTKAERCANPTVITTIGNTTCTIQANVPNGFPAGDDGADTQATCEIYLNMPGAPIPATATLLNVCSFPSGQPNSNPFDCVVTIGSGFIQIVKTTNVTTSTLFGFTLSSNAAGFTSVNYAVQGGISSAFIPLLPTSGNTKYALAEQLPTSGWAFASAVCKIGTTTVGTSSGNGVSNIPVESGKTTVCTFDNDGDVTGPATYTVVVTNTGTVAATVSSLSDDKFGNLLGFPNSECPTAGKTLQPGGTYTCVFTRTLTGLPGSTHTNIVSARATDAQGNLTAIQTATKIVTLPTP